MPRLRGRLAHVRIRALGRSKVARAVATIREEIEYSRLVLDKAGKHEPDEYLISLAALTYVAGRVSAPRVGFRNEIKGQPLPSLDSEAVLAWGVGLCGNAAQLFTDLLTTSGTRARTVQIFYDGGGHVVSEVEWHGTWHCFDPTWGRFWRRAHEEPSSVLSLDEVLALADDPGHHVVDYPSMLWNQIVEEAGLGRETGRDFLERSDLRVEIVDG